MLIFYLKIVLDLLVCDSYDIMFLRNGKKPQGANSDPSLPFLEIKDVLTDAFQ